MSIFGIMFLLSVLGCVGISLYKFYNLMSAGDKYSLKLSFLLFSGFIILWFFGQMVFFLYPENLLYMQLHRMNSILLILNGLTLFAEILIAIAKQASKDKITPFMSAKNMPVNRTGRQ